MPRGPIPSKIRSSDRHTHREDSAMLAVWRYIWVPNAVDWVRLVVLGY